MSTTTTPTPIVVPDTAVDLDGLRTWLLANTQTQTTAYSIMALIKYTFNLYIKIVQVRLTTLPYQNDPSLAPGKQGRIDILISDGSDPDCLYQHIVLDCAFDFTNTREWIVTISPLTPQ
jgi:hypothetical protein